MKILRSFSLIHFLPVLIILSLLPHIPSLPVSYLILNLTSIILFYVVDLKLISLPITIIKFILTLLAILMIPINFGFHFTQNIATVLLSALICLKLLEIENFQDKRNIFVILFLGYFLIATYFINNQSLAITLYAITLLFFITLNLAIFARAPLTTIPIRSILLIIGKLSIYAIPFTLILFLFFPRLPGPLWTLPNNDDSGTTGISGEMYPGSINTVSESHEIAFRIDFEGSVPSPDKLYWRGPVLTQTDGFSWQQSIIHNKKLKQPLNNIISDRSDIINYKITLEPQRQPWIFTLEMPEHVRSNFLKKPYLTRDLQFRVKHKITQVVQYQVRSASNFKFWSQEPVEIALASQFPGGTNPRTFQLGSQWKNETTDKRQIIQKAMDLFRYNDFYYTRTPPLMITNPADQFLFDYKKGFCENFASSFVLLMRASGIPARVVAGYQGIEYNKTGGYYVVRQSNAHAWAEVWLENEGWLRFDPTAVIPQDHIDDNIFDYRSRDLEYLNINYANINELSQKFILQNWQTISDFINTADEYIDNLKYTWNNWLLGYDAKKQRLVMKFLGFKSHWKSMILLMVGLLFAFFAIIFYSLVIKTINRDDPEVIQYKRLLRKLTKKGLTISYHDGPEAIRQKAIKAFKSQAPQLKALFDYYIHLRYGKSQQYFSTKDFKKMVSNLKI